LEAEEIASENAAEFDYLPYGIVEVVIADCRR
jgi:hypothetical protein